MPIEPVKFLQQSAAVVAPDALLELEDSAIIRTHGYSMGEIYAAMRAMMQMPDDQLNSDNSADADLDRLLIESQFFKSAEISDSAYGDYTSVLPPIMETPREQLITCLFILDVIANLALLAILIAAKCKRRHLRSSRLSTASIPPNCPALLATELQFHRTSLTLTFNRPPTPPELRQRHFVASLAIANIIGSFGIFSKIIFPYIGVPYLCNELPGIACLKAAHMLILASLCGCSIDHFLAVIYPLFHRTRSSILGSRYLASTLVMWLVATLLFLSDFLWPILPQRKCTDDTPLQGRTALLLFWDFSSARDFCNAIVCHHSYILETLQFSSWLPFISIILVCYARLLLFLTKNYCATRPRRQSPRMRRRSLNGVLLTAFVILTFVGAWLPHMVVEVMAPYASWIVDSPSLTPDFLDQTFITTEISLMVYCFATPIIYGSNLICRPHCLPFSCEKRWPRRLSKPLGRIVS